MVNADLTRYQDGTPYTVIDPRFGYAATPTQPEGWGDGGGGGESGPPAASTAVLVPPSGDATGATDRTAIQAAIDAASDAWTVAAPYFTNAELTTVELHGKYWINGALTMKDGVRLRGQGWMGTSIHLANGANSRIISSGVAWWFTVEDLQLDGHSESQTAGDAGVYIGSGGVGMPAGSCTWPIVRNVFVQYTYGTGFWFGAVEMRAIMCYAYRTNVGFEIAGSDMFIESCTAGESKTIGFLVTGSAHHIVNCKSWWPGYVQTSRTGLASKSGAAEDNLNFCCWDIRGGENQITNCDGQDARGATWVVRGSSNRMDVQADASDGPCLTIIGGDSNLITLNIGGGSSHGTQSAGAVSLWGNSEQYNVVRTNWPNITIAGPLPLIATAAHGGGWATWGKSNDIVIGSPSSVQPTTYAATVTPDPVLGGPQVTLTGAITIANPAADRFVPHTEFTIVLVQDATGGRTVSWGSAYVGMSAIDTGANKMSRWTVKCTDYGGKWVQTHFVSF